MYPLLFIILLAIALVILAYLYLALIVPEEKSRSNRPGRWFAFEAAPELFKYVEPDEYRAVSGLNLTRLSPTRINVNWRLLPDKWPKGHGKYKDLADTGRLVLRLYRNGELLEIEDIEVDKTSGTRKLELGEDYSCCASLGLKKGDSFTPLLFSNTLMRQATMQWYHRSRV